MKNLGILLVVILASSTLSCKFMAKELKKVNVIRKAAKRGCDCKFVDVESDYDLGVNSVTINVQRTSSADLASTADSIMANVKRDFPKICNHDKIFIIFKDQSNEEGKTVDEQFTFYGCDPEPDHDIINTYSSEELEDLENSDTLEALNPPEEEVDLR